MTIEYDEMLTLLPHRGKMLFLDRVLDFDAEKATLAAEWQVTASSPFFDSALGGVPGWTAFECMAQAVSVLSGLRGRGRGEKPKAGFILSLSMKIAKTFFAAGDTVEVRVAEDFSLNSIYTFLCTAESSGEKTAEAKLTVMDLENGASSP
jgi:predicted hotdog family 3-hydroxylacyl-ACP dehydratase